MASPFTWCRWRRRRSFQASACILVATALSILYFFASIPRVPVEQNASTLCNPVVPNITEYESPLGEKSEQPNPWDTIHYVKGPPKNRFQDNLRKDAFYITSWANAGFTNQFMSYANMIYLGLVSDRIPIIPPFAPDHHLSPSAGPLPFAEIFNLTELRKNLRKPILEWSEVKSLAPRLSLDVPSSIEQIGCWSIRPPDQKDPILARNLLRHLGLEVSYTRLPSNIRYPPALAANAHISLMPLAQKIYPLNPIKHDEDNIIMASSPSGSQLAPGHHMSCFDFMYYASVGAEPYEWKSSWSPVWRLVGRHLLFTDSILDLAKQYVRRALLVTSNELPPFITVHARRGDFAHQCFDVPGNCLAPLSAYVRKVKEIQGSLFVKTGIKVTEVIITSDEQDPAFWREVKEVGWNFVDHAAEHTLKRYGEWYVPIIDITVQSLGVGFVGSIDSTVSIVSAHRVENWNDGITRMVNWGDRE